MFGSRGAGNFLTKLTTGAAVVFMLSMAAIVLWASAPRALFAAILVCIFMPMMQRVVVGGLDFSMMRLIMLVAWARVLLRGEYRGFKPSKFDLFFVLWITSSAIVYVLRLGPSGIVPRLGTSFDALTVFFLFRVLVRRREQVFLVVQQLPNRPLHPCSNWRKKK